MALILNRYSGYFIKGALNHKKYEEGYRAYFDPNCREFIWVNPAHTPNSICRLIPLPIISEYDVYCSFLMAHGLENVLKTHIELGEIDFCIAVRKEAENIGFEEALREYAIQEYSSIMQRWITDNAIENCKLTIEPYNGSFATKDDVEEYLRYTKEQVRYEAEQEAAYKNSIDSVGNCTKWIYSD